LIHYLELKQKCKYKLLNSVDTIVGTFECIEPYGNLKRAIFTTEDGCKYLVLFLDLINVLEISSLEAELL
jgi:hypothetical protein